MEHKTDDARKEISRRVLETPLEEIQEDSFFRADNFMYEPWYNEFMIYRNLGVCQPEPEYVLEVQKALKVMGYSTHVAERGGQLYLLPGEERSESMQKEWKMEQLEERRKQACDIFRNYAQNYSRQKNRER